MQGSKGEGTLRRERRQVQNKKYKKVKMDFKHEVSAMEISKANEYQQKIIQNYKQMRYFNILKMD